MITTIRSRTAVRLPVGFLLTVGLLFGLANAQEITPTMGIDLPVLGRLTPRAAREIAASSWSIGGETLDRDFTDYASYKAYLGPLGAKGIRLQTGWAKCEKRSGVYDFSWLDVIVDDARAQGVQPWLELSYGNPIYPGGSGSRLGDGFPHSPEALAAWDRWVAALVGHFRDRVSEWEIWNEPDGNRTGQAPAAAYVDLHIRTATIIRAAQPAARIYALGLAAKIDYADAVLAGLQAKGKLGLVDAITIHGYPHNPDDTSNIDALRAVIAKYSPSIEARQGETGAPSRLQPTFALKNLPWSETTQAKWDLRRLLAHRAKDVPTSLFTMSDMRYNWNGELRLNFKGLLGANPDLTISHVKAAYPAMQHVFTVFDDTLVRLADYPWTGDVPTPRRLALIGYAQHGSDRQVVALWLNDAPPVDDNLVTTVRVTLPKGSFREPVLADLRTGLVYRLPPELFARTPTGFVFHALPVYDSPLLLAEAAVLRFAPVQP